MNAGDQVPVAGRQSYDAFVRKAAADPDVVGLLLAGSRGSGAFVTDQSDFDVYVVVRARPGPWKTPHGAPVETWPMTLDAFRVHALVGTDDAWNRATFLGAQVVLDRSGGEVTRITDRKRVLDSAEADSLATTSLGEYVNSLYRSLRNLEAGRDLEGRLDALETLSPMLTAAFALESRVRPFNKWLLHEVARRPLSIPGLIELVEEIAAGPTASSQREAFRLIEDAARHRGYGGIIDDWEPDVAWLRHPDDRR